MATIALSDGFIPSSKDTPLDKRTRVNLYEEIQNIKNPYVGMEILVLADETNSGRKTRYRVESLKANDLGMENALIDMTTIKKIESYEVNLEELIHITKAKIDEFLLNPVLDAEGVAYERQLYQIDNLIPFDIEDEYIARIGTEEIVIKVKEIDRLEFIGYDKSIKLHLNLDNTGEYNENYACLEFVGITVDNSNDLYLYKSDTIYINEDAIPKCYPKEIKVREIIDRALENINSIEYEELETTDNTIIGAINELKRALANITTGDSGEAVNLPFNSIDKGFASSNIDFSEIKNGTYCYIIRGSIGYDVPEGNLPLNNDMVHITKSNIAMTVITLNGDIYTYNGGTNGTNYISCTKDNFMTYSVASETYQPKNDSKLITNNKTVVGAINELKNALDSVDGAFTILTVSPTYEELDTLPEGGKVYILNGLGIDGDPVHIYKSGNNITITTIYGTINKYIKSGTTWTNYSTEETTTKSYVDRAIANAQLIDLAEYQKITDNSLVTIDKTIVGAINELKSSVDGITVPTKTSDLTNDSGFITSIPSEYITETELETKGYLTEHQDISNLALKSEIPDVSSFITSDDLPTVPTKVSDLANDRNYISSIPSEYVTETELNAKGYLTEHQDISNLQSKTDNSLTTTDKTIVGAINKINEQYETIEKKVNDHIESCSGGGTSIDDATISTDRTWSSAKIEDFVHTNDDVVWSTVQGENLSVDYSKEGYLREVEIWGNTIQNQEYLSDIQHLGELYVDEEGQPILDSEGREQYKIEVESCNDNLNTTDSIYILEGNQSYPTIKLDNTAFKPSTKYEVTIKVLENTLDAEIVDFTAGHFSVFSDRLPGMSISKGFIGEKKAIQSTVSDFSNRLENYTFRYDFTQVTNGYVKLKICIRERETLSDIGYIPHVSNKTTLLLPCQLMKIGDIADRLYWDSSKGRYVVEKNIIDKVFNGSEEWRKWGANTDELKSFDVRWLDIPIHDNLFSGISDIFPPITGFNALYGNNGEGIAGHSGNWFVVCISSEKAQDLTSFKNWLSVNNLRVYHKRITPQLIETNIIEQILLPCYKDKTHLFVTGGIDGSIKAKVPLDGGQAIQSLSTMNLALNEEVSTLSLENEELKSTNDTQNELINTTMLATDEMYMMIEPLLSESVQTLSLERSLSKMVDLYVAMVQRGLKTIDAVPTRYREQVKEILAQLEK